MREGNKKWEKIKKLSEEKAEAMGKFMKSRM